VYRKVDAVRSSQERLAADSCRHAIFGTCSGFAEFTLQGKLFVWNRFWKIPTIRSCFILRDTTSTEPLILRAILYTTFPNHGVDQPGNCCSTSITWKIAVRLHAYCDLPAPACRNRLPIALPSENSGTISKDDFGFPNAATSRR